MESELFKAMWLVKSTGALKTFVFDSYHDDPQNKRMLFTYTDKDKVLTIFYDDISFLITTPYGET